MCKIMDVTNVNISYQQNRPVWLIMVTCNNNSFGETVLHHNIIVLYERKDFDIKKLHDICYLMGGGKNSDQVWQDFVCCAV